MFIECPHCHTRVLPLANNICPACRKDISDTRGVDPNLASLVVHQLDSLPHYCYSCNLPTERNVKIMEKVEIGGDSPFAKFLLLVLGILTLRLSILGSRQEGKKSSVLVSMPQCERCAKSGKPKPNYVDFEKQSMTFIVHRGFRERVYRMHEK